MQCASHLKQLGLALHTFELTYGWFPPGRVNGPFPQLGVPNATNHAIFPLLLPYLEQSTLARQYRWDRIPQDPANQPTTATHLKVLQCPSAESNRYHTQGVWETNGTRGACTDYAPIVNVNPTLADLGLVDRTATYTGVLPVNGQTRVAEITDGTSQTIMMVECGGRPKPWRVGRLVDAPFVSGGPWAAEGNRIALWGATQDGSTRLGPCAFNCTNESEVYAFHPGGANFLFADGSVQFLRAGLSIRVVARLVTRAGGEVVSANDY
jgi:prepilin-type processing-associated H-X9-DG protein